MIVGAGGRRPAQGGGCSVAEASRTIPASTCRRGRPHGHAPALAQPLTPLRRSTRICQRAIEVALRVHRAQPLNGEIARSLPLSASHAERALAARNASIRSIPPHEARPRSSGAPAQLLLESKERRSQTLFQTSRCRERTPPPQPSGRGRAGLVQSNGRGTRRAAARLLSGPRGGEGGGPRGRLSGRRGTVGIARAIHRAKPRASPTPSGFGGPVGVRHERRAAAGAARHPRVIVPGWCMRSRRSVSTEIVGSSTTHSTGTIAADKYVYEWEGDPRPSAAPRTPACAPDHRAAAGRFCSERGSDHDSRRQAWSRPAPVVREEASATLPRTPVGERRHGSGWDGSSLVIRPTADPVSGRRTSAAARSPRLPPGNPGCG